MENAGANAYAAVRDHLWAGASAAGPLVFVAGRGNNGGDALVMARHARNGGANDVVVVLAGGEPRPGAAADNLAACRALGIPVVTGDDARAAIASATWIFDGITGTGLRAELAAPLAAVVARINAAPGKVVAIDLPSGLRDGYRSGPLVRATATVTMGLPKRCLYLPAVRTGVGEVLVVAVGFPRVLLTDPANGCDLLTGDLLADLLPAAAVDAHKGTRGHVGVFAAAPGATGAGLLACTAAARVGAGLVTLYADAQTYALVAPAARSTMCRSLDGTGGPDLQRLLARHQALLVGPGWGVNAERRALLGELLAAPRSGVLDADGLTLLAQLAAAEGQPRRLHGRWVLTPHPGEMGRLLGIPTAEVLADPAAAATAAADRWQASVILKGHVSYVAGAPPAPAPAVQAGRPAPGGPRLALLDAGNPALGTGGAGDVLAGVVAGLMSRGMTTDAAARAGVLVHACAGEQALGAGGWFLAEDLLPHLGRAAWPGAPQQTQQTQQTRR
jgi:NAD(P)H-hydrate epimerase